MIWNVISDVGILDDVRDSATQRLSKDGGVSQHGVERRQLSVSRLCHALPANWTQKETVTPSVLLARDCLFAYMFGKDWRKNERRQRRG